MNEAERPAPAAARGQGVRRIAVAQSALGQPAILEPLAVLAYALHSALEENLHLAGRRLAGFGLGRARTRGSSSRTRPRVQSVLVYKKNGKGRM